MTSRAPLDPERARKVVRVRSLTDPLGAMGQRRTSERVAREHRARRAVFLSAVAVFAGTLGGIMVREGSAPPDTSAESAPPSAPEVASLPVRPAPDLGAPAGTAAQWATNPDAATGGITALPTATLVPSVTNPQFAVSDAPTEITLPVTDAPAAPVAAPEPAVAQAPAPQPPVTVMRPNRRSRVRTHSS